MTRHTSRLISRATKLAIALVCLAAGLAYLGKAAEAPAQTFLHLPSGVPARFAIADFDGDQKPDLATVQIDYDGAGASHYSIRFQLSTGAESAIGITAPLGGLQISPRDVNGDNFLDLIVTTTWQRQPVAILVNDGHGKFTMVDPGAFPAAIRESETLWNAATMQPRDDATLVQSRSLVGEAEDAGWVSRPDNVASGGCFADCRTASHPFFASFFGRAPPTFPV